MAGPTRTEAQILRFVSADVDSVTHELAATVICDLHTPPLGVERRGAFAGMRCERIAHCPSHTQIEDANLLRIEGVTYAISFIDRGAYVGAWVRVGLNRLGT